MPMTNVSYIYIYRVGLRLRRQLAQLKQPQKIRINFSPSSKIRHLCLQLAKMAIDVRRSPILLRESSKFVKLVREYNNGEVYDRFKQILKDQLERRNSCVETSSKIDELFNDHIQLAQGFHGFKKIFNSTVYHAKLEDRFAINDNQRYLDYFEILQGFHSGQKSMAKIVQELAILFTGHMDLFLGFCEFLPRDFDFGE
ncbi:paired amphipathic helix protein Sin3-like 1 isoform X3 [Corylus avellana]|uniref:paired amphipathic helix protein Sin3-like 1 isoform X3 n=1 Tax=Corylus avellana TaxID=13451 RepID=UPI00286A3DDA|nr:paired amphipathic helix protein Sin3-like 1 isoform X3 [Corylus avellana]